MTAAILEIRDGVATGPLHQPVEKRLIGKNLWQRFDEVEPLEWPTVCGITGYVYQRAGLTEMGHTSECFECATAEYRLEARRRVRRDHMRRTRGTVAQAPRPCENCGKPFVPSIRGARSGEFAAKYCGASCRKAAYRARKRAA